MSTVSNAKPKPAGEPAKPKAIPRDRMISAEFIMGAMMNVTLFETETVDDGVQDAARWELVAPRLAMNQWLQITNDAGSMWRLMRVERLHASPGSGLRGLVLRDVVPPRFFDLENEPIVATGEYHVRYGGAHRRWMVITPQGTVARDQINSEHEARIHAHRDSNNPRPL
jgi:hypothetical protein